MTVSYTHLDVYKRQARELDKLESQNKHLTEQQQMIQQMERQRAQQARIAELQAGWDRDCLLYTSPVHR